MATLVQRTPSMLSVDYYNPRDNTMMDADTEMCRLFGSLNLTACGPVLASTANEAKQSTNLPVPQTPQPEEDMSMTVESEMTTVTDGEGNIQVSPPPSRSGYPYLEIYETKQFVETTPSNPSLQQHEAVEGCALIQVLAAHYAPRLSRLHCVTRDPDFNLLDTIFSHREQFVAFPYGHRTCSSALTKIAFEIERRNNAGQPYHDDPDIDMVIALHNEAWLMSGWYSK